MTLIDDVQTVCRRLAPQGWADLLAKHSLDITAPNLAEELARELPDIRRDLPGFEDFAMEGKRGIEPGCPARLSSPQPAVPHSHLSTRLPDSPRWLQVSRHTAQRMTRRPPSPTSRPTPSSASSPPIKRPEPS